MMGLLISVEKKVGSYILSFFSCFSYLFGEQSQC